MNIFPPEIVERFLVAFEQLAESIDRMAAVMEQGAAPVIELTKEEIAQLEKALRSKPRRTK